MASSDVESVKLHVSHSIQLTLISWVRVISLQTFNCDAAIGDPSVDDISHGKQFFYPVSYAVNGDTFVSDISHDLKKLKLKTITALVESRQTVYLYMKPTNL